MNGTWNPLAQRDWTVPEQRKAANRFLKLATQGRNIDLVNYYAFWGNEGTDVALVRPPYKPHEPRAPVVSSTFRDRPPYVQYKPSEAKRQAYCVLTGRAASFCSTAEGRGTRYNGADGPAEDN
jgi:hypothetical protein